MCVVTRLALTVAFVAVGAQQPAFSESGATKPTDLHASGTSILKAGKQTLVSAPFNAVLKKHLKQGRIDYDGLHADAEARARLETYVEAIGGMTENEPLSSWINTYNALVVHAVLERYPLASVKDVFP